MAAIVSTMKTRTPYPTGCGPEAPHYESVEPAPGTFGGRAGLQACRCRAMITDDMSRRLFWPLLAAVLISGCKKNQPPPSGEQITGNERLGWTQQATDAVELADFKYAIYVDGARSPLAGTSCSTMPSSGGFDCSAPLPTMSAGAHALELASYVEDGTVLESARASPLR